MNFFQIDTGLEFFIIIFYFRTSSFKMIILINIEKMYFNIVLFYIIKY